MPCADRRRLTVGIIGGLGPQATADLFRKIISRTRVEREQDHLHILIESQPDMPDRHAAIAGRGPSAGPYLAAVARNLERAGADFLVLASNTPHFYAAEIGRAVSIPFIDMVEETCAALKQRFPLVRSVGLLAAEGCLHAGLYQRALLARSIRPILPGPTELTQLMEAIYEVKLGTAAAKQRTSVRTVARRLISRGAEALILACTELPLLIVPEEMPCPVLDCTDILAESAVASALRQRILHHERASA